MVRKSCIVVAGIAVIAEVVAAADPRMTAETRMTAENKIDIVAEAKSTVEERRIVDKTMLRIVAERREQEHSIVVVVDKDWLRRCIDSVMEVERSTSLLTAAAVEDTATRILTTKKHNPEISIVPIYQDLDHFLPLL